jgi:hypothetical protein
MFPVGTILAPDMPTAADDDVFKELNSSAAAEGMAPRPKIASF